GGPWPMSNGAVHALGCNRRASNQRLGWIAAHPFSAFKSLLDAVQWKRVRDHPIPRHFAPRALHEVQRPRQQPSVVLEEGDEPQTDPTRLQGIKRKRETRHDRADLQVRPAGPE